MPEQLTLEKLKIHERLTVLETRFDTLEQKITENIEKLNHIIIGNGKPGLSESVRELQKRESDREKYVTAGLIATVGLIVKTIYDAITNHRI